MTRGGGSSPCRCIDTPHTRAKKEAATEAALPIVQRTQAIEQMLNARWWPGLFFREQNPEPLSYFRTDCGVVG
jgi:hypothetical protein